MMSGFLYEHKQSLSGFTKFDYKAFFSDGMLIAKISEFGAKIKVTRAFFDE